jgi:hypothetical protein
MTVRDDVLAAVDQHFRTPRDVAGIVGKWAYVSIRHELLKLAEEGLLETRRQPIPSGYQWLYRKR